MSRKYFVKKNYFGKTVFMLLYAFIIFVSGIAAYRFPDTVPAVLIILFFCGCLTAALIRCAKSCGLYIDGDKIYYKDVLSSKSKAINPKEIKGIKTVRTESPNHRHSLSPHIRHKGQYLYIMILTGETNADMLLSNYGDISFCRRFKNHILCSVTYNEAVMNELLRLNHDIEIINHRYLGKIKPTCEKIPGRI
ncbi:MAG: hypothetical protein LUD81_03010 [Clostridiales bacterium]|nr:hypothetical protein [Clostridiales bacterium]